MLGGVPFCTHIRLYKCLLYYTTDPKQSFYFFVQHFIMFDIRRNLYLYLYLYFYLCLRLCLCPTRRLCIYIYITDYDDFTNIDSHYFSLERKGILNLLTDLSIGVFRGSVGWFTTSNTRKYHGLC